jgi:hypothetical protein
MVVIPAGEADGKVLWTAAALLAYDDPDVDAGVVLVGNDSVIENRFYIMGLSSDAKQLGEVYIAQK